MPYNLITVLYIKRSDSSKHFRVRHYCFRPIEVGLKFHVNFILNFFSFKVAEQQFHTAGGFHSIFVPKYFVCLQKLAVGTPPKCRK